MKRSKTEALQKLEQIYEAELKNYEKFKNRLEESDTAYFVIVKNNKLAIDELPLSNLRKFPMPTRAMAELFLNQNRELWQDYFNL